MHLSIVLPTLHRLDTAMLVAARLRELFGAAMAFEIILVANCQPAMPLSSNVKIVLDRGRGVYAAYRAGINAACGDYVWLVGDDDLPLDALVEIVPLIIAGTTDLIVAPVVYSTGRVYKQTRSALTLLFYNWCQQGVIYRTALLRKYRFYRRLKVQADHFVNVLMFSDPAVRVAFLKIPICLFGANGISSRGGDQFFRRIRPRLARRTLSMPSLCIFRVVVLMADVVKFFRRLRG